MIKRQFTDIIQSSIFKNLSVLVIGTIIAQLILIAFQMVLRRLYTPAEFGAFAVYYSIASILSTLAALRYEQALVLPKTNQGGYHLLLVTLFLSLFTFIVLSLFCFLIPDKIGALIGLAGTFTFWIYFLPLTVLTISIIQSLNSFLIREKLFRYSASIKVYRRITEGIIQTSGKSFLGTAGLIWGDILGQMVVIVHNLWRIVKKYSQPWSYEQLVAIARVYKSFPLKNGLPALMNTISLMLPVIIVSRKFDAVTTGYFDLARMVLIIPLSLVTTSLSQVLWQKFAEKRSLNQSIRNDVLGTLTGLVVFALGFGLLLQFFAPLIFTTFFGDAWGTSGTYTQILIWAFAIKFVVSPFNIVFTAFEKIGILSIWQVFYFLLIIGLLLYPFKSMIGFLYAYLAIEIVSYTLVAILNTLQIVNYEKRLRA